MKSVVASIIAAAVIGVVAPQASSLREPQESKSSQNLVIDQSADIAKMRELAEKLSNDAEDIARLVNETKTAAQAAEKASEDLKVIARRHQVRLRQHWKRSEQWFARS